MKVFPTNALSNGSTLNTDKAKPRKFFLHYLANRKNFSLA